MHCNGLYAALLCVFERSDYLPGFLFEDVHKSMVASPYNSLTLICESHPLGIGDAQSLVMARPCDIMSHHEIRHICDL